jgi:site-specific DNA-cytosine methylase
MKAVSVHGFGGGFTLGAVQAGFDLEATMSRQVGFGVYSTLANRHLLGQHWPSIAGPPETWDTMEADMIFGNPPCSGFSTLSSKGFRGLTSPINEYMWELIRYAGRVKPAIVVWESVQGTFRQGLPLMRQLHDELQRISGLDYHLTHVLHNNASVGGVSNRKRYFWVASRVPFGVEVGGVDPNTGVFRDLKNEVVPVMDDALLDLEGLRLTMAEQPYKGVQWVGEFVDDDWDMQYRAVVQHSTDWARREMHDGSGMIDGHDIYRSPTLARAQQLMALEEWPSGENMGKVMKRFYERTGALPPRSWEYITKDSEGNPVTKAKRLIDTDFFMGVNQVMRWHGDRLANVITGGGVHLVLHPREDRTLTHREVARIQGFPDAWKIWPVRNVADIGPAWGKGVPVQAGRWIAYWAKESLEGRPGSIVGDSLAVSKKSTASGRTLKAFGPREHETVIDCTWDFKTRPTRMS